MATFSITEAFSALSSSTSALSSSGGVTVDLDITFAAQFVLFFLLFLILKPLLFQPMLKLFEEREKRIKGAKDIARDMYSDADKTMAEYEARLEQIKREAGEERDRLRADGLRLESQLLSKVRSETSQMVEDGKNRISEQSRELRAELKGNVELLASDIATRVLGREVQS